MKKILSIILLLCMVLGMVGCQSQEAPEEAKKDPKEIIESHQFEDKGWKMGMWTVSFADMELVVIFNQTDAEDYFVNKPLVFTEIKSVQLYPDQTKKSEWIYLKSKDNQFVIDEEDIEQYKDQGRQEALQNYNQKIEDLKITTHDIGQWLIQYFNENVRPQLRQKAQELGKELVQKIKDARYSYVQDSNGRTIISSKKDKYKIVITLESCMIVNADMALDGKPKNGYLYNATLGTAGAVKNDQTKFVYQYSNNTFLEGKASLEEYADIQDIKKWYDKFLNQFDIDTETLLTAK